MSIKATIYPLSLYVMFFFANGRHVMATGSSLSSSLSYRPRAPVHPELLPTEEEEVGEGKGGGLYEGRMRVLTSRLRKWKTGETE